MRNPQKPPEQTLPIQRHPSLPQNVSNNALALWLDNNAIERFTDERKQYFESEELTAFAKESSVNGREINRLEDMLKEVSSLVKKGNEQAVTFTVPITLGTKMLETHRRENDDFIEKGYTTEKTEIYGVPNVDSHMMEYFTIDGEEVKERRRPLSPKEKHNFVGMFGDVKNGVDQSTGEVLDETASKMFIPGGFQTRTGTEDAQP